MKLWMDGQLLDEVECRISAMSHALHYGTGAFEGIRAYSAGERIVVFRMMDHLARLKRSCRALGIELGYTEEALRDAIISVIAANGLRNAYIRPLVYIGPGSLSLKLPGELQQGRVLIAAWDWDSYFSLQSDHGLSVITGVGRRITSQARLRQAKVAGAYANAYVAALAAKEKGADEALLVDESGFVAEASAANIFMVKDNVITTPTCRVALAGITRDTIITLAGQRGYVIREGEIATEDLYGADELFLTGTAYQIVPVTAVDGRQVATGQIGAVTRSMQDSYRTAVHSSRSFVSNVCIPDKSFRAA